MILFSLRDRTRSCTNIWRPAGAVNLQVQMIDINPSVDDCHTSHNDLCYYAALKE